MIRFFFKKASRPIDTGKLIKSGQDFTVRYTTHADIKHNLALQDNVLEALKKNGKTHYLIYKDTAYLKRHLNAGHKIIGTFIGKPGLLSDEQLVAHLLITDPRTEEEAGVADSSLLPSEDLKSISVVSNILVHQDFRGNKLMQQMLDHWLQIASDSGKQHAIAEASTDNKFSWSVFLDSGFVIYGHAYDHRDGTNNFYLHKPLDKTFVYSQDPEHIETLILFDEHDEIKTQAYETLQKRLKDNYHVLGFDHHTNTILLAKCIGTKPLPSHTPPPPSSPALD
jgi:predicted GNAT family N-acyltransferase